MAGADGRLRAHFGLGSNLGDRWAILGHAVDRLAALDEDAVVSPIYETEPMGGPGGQQSYLNCVVRVVLDLAPAGFLELAAALEREAGRERRERWGPRTLDVDVLLLESLVGGAPQPVSVDSPLLQVPHPRMHERAFVLAPLEDCTPGLVPPGWRDRLGGDAAVAAAIRRVGTIVRLPAP